MNWSGRSSVIMLLLMGGVFAGSAVNGLTHEPLLSWEVRVPLLVFSLIGLCFYPVFLSLCDLGGPVCGWWGARAISRKEFLERVFHEDKKVDLKAPWFCPICGVCNEDSTEPCWCCGSGIPHYKV